MSTSHTEFPVDRRRFLRIQFDGSTELSIAGRTQAVELIDLSLKGALVTSQEPLSYQPGENVQLTIHLSDSQVELKLDATLVRQENERIGCRFGVIDIDTLTHLRRLIELNLGDEAMLERELEHLFSQD